MTELFSLKGDQPKAWDAITKWWKTPADKRKQVFRLFGSAGVGKTTIAVKAKELGNVAYMCLSGKAALVMRSKGCDGASTIHSRIYFLDKEVEGKPQWKLNRAALTGVDLVVMDEVGMVDPQLGEDVLSFGKPVLVLGDGQQLPPPKEAPSFFLASGADFTMREVLRQAKDSPIIELAYQVLETGTVRPGRYGDCEVVVGARAGYIEQKMREAEQILCGKNVTRADCNFDMRRWLNLQGEFAQEAPMVGDRLICLKNNHKKMILNGEQFLVESISDSYVGNDVCSFVAKSTDMETLPATYDVPIEFFKGTEKTLPRYTVANFDQFTYAYVLTTHKAQGSQWDNVLVLDESRAFREFKKNHLYTAITRAVKKVTVIL